MKAWLKGGLIGGGISIFVFVINIMVAFLWKPFLIDMLIKPTTWLNLLFYGVFIFGILQYGLLGFLIGALVGWLVGRKK